MRIDLLLRLGYAIFGGMIGALIGFVVNFLNGISGDDATLIVMGFALTGALLVAAIPMLIFIFTSLFTGGEGADDFDMGFDIEVDNHDDIHFDPLTPDKLPSGKLSPWRRHRSDE